MKKPRKRAVIRRLDKLVSEIVRKREQKVAKYSVYELLEFEKELKEILHKLKTK